jgi:thiamine-phosphate pyrophosphorylase
MATRFDLSLYLVTDRRLAGPRGVIETVRSALAGGVTLVQLRDPEAETRALEDEARALKALLAPHGIPLVINDRTDVALSAGADGVHLGQDDMDPRDARRLLGPNAIIGLSVGSPAELAASAQTLGAVDYLGTGPVNATATKAGAGDAIGPAGVAAVVARSALPVVAIGGIGAGHAAAAIEAGARGIAVVSAIMAAPDPERAARDLRAIVDAARRTAGRR